MLGKLLLLFTIVPVVELYLLITVGQHLGAGPTIGLVLITGILGATLARREGSRVLRNWQSAMARGEMPKEGVVSSLLVLVGGVLLVTPGIVTDVTGLLLLVPWSRRAIAGVLRRRLEQRMQVQPMDPMNMDGPRMFVDLGGLDGRPPSGTVIDVDAVETDGAWSSESDPREHEDSLR